MPRQEANCWRNGNSPKFMPMATTLPRDDIKAYDYFSQIVTNYDADDPNRRDRNSQQ
jgi:hypothetical protein